MMWKLTWIREALGNSRWRYCLPLPPIPKEEIVVGLKVEGRGPVTQLDARVRKVSGIFLVVFPLLGLARIRKLCLRSGGS